MLVLNGKLLTAPLLRSLEHGAKAARRFLPCPAQLGMSALVRCGRYGLGTEQEGTNTPFVGIRVSSRAHSCIL